MVFFLPARPLRLFSCRATTLTLQPVLSRGVPVEGLEQLMALARSRDPADRARLLDALVTLCQQFDSAGQTLPPVIRQMLESLFLSVVADAEHDLRVRLSGQLADAAWAPK